jgi:ATP-dependent Clp protease protease subunit
MRTGLLGSTPPQSPKNEVYGFFAGVIDQQAVQRIFNGLAAASSNNVDHIHLLMQSTGGHPGDGICLYNLFRNLNMGLTIYNCGQISSIATLAYLGAKERKTSAHATFMIHRTYANPVGATSDRLQSVAQTLLLDDQRTEAIFREALKLSDDQWTSHKYLELWLSADDAIKCKLATEIGEFAPPIGQKLFTL